MREHLVTPTVAEISSESITELFRKHWSADSVDFQQHVVDEIYEKEMKTSGFSTRKIMLLEINQYLEKYLWPYFSADQGGNVPHLVSIAAMVNEKFREGVDAWRTIKQSPQAFPAYFTSLTKLILDSENQLSFKEKKVLLVFLNHCFNGVEVDLIRERIQKYVSLPIWICLADKRRERELNKAPMLKKFWNAMKKKDAKLDEAALTAVMFERRFLFNLVQQFFGYLTRICKLEESASLDRQSLDIVNYCEKFLEFLIDLEALLPTRRFVNAVLDDACVVVVCKKSALCQRPVEGRLFNQLLERLNFYCRFEIDDITGEALTKQEITKRHYDKIVGLQKLVFKKFPYLRRFYMNSVASVDTRESLIHHLQQLKEDDLLQLCKMLNIADDQKIENELNRNVLLELLVFAFERVVSQIQALNEMPLYPTEDTIWDENVVPSQYYSTDVSLALPKLNLQFLTLHDYLLRNFELFRLESTYEIRQDIESSLARMRPWRSENGSTMFGGWARMALTIDSFTIVEIAKPKLGEKAPSRVRAEIRVNLNVRKEIKREWESLRKHDVCFLISVKPSNPPGTPVKFSDPFVPQVGLKYVRGCEIEGMLDPLGKIVEEGSNERFEFDTDFRTYRVWLDCNQYLLDVTTDKLEDVYDRFNVLLRRKPKENNFKAVLEAIRDLMNTDCVVPEWIHDILLGYGDPGAAHYKNMQNQQKVLDFNDTFLDLDHLKSCFPDYDVGITGNSRTDPRPPFKVEFDEDRKHLSVTPYVLPNRGPYPFEQPKKNCVRFTPTQVEAIRSGMQPGLTLVVGPPGTGKTDVAVQIISNLYHSCPEQRTLIVTHSNQALNQLFEKIIALDVSERHLLRLGHGEEELDTEKDFSRYGRVNYVLKKRLALLTEVSRLAASLGINADVGYTCETASYFFLYHVLSRWEEYMSKLAEKQKDAQLVSSLFPFHKFFENAPQPLFHGQSYEENLDIAKGCYRHIKKVFTQLDEFKAFEMLRSGSDRSKYLLVREARIIAMTCTHAALKRKELVDIGFQYDNILMEEAAQILEIETFIPLLLQNPEHGHNRLKRWIMIGDHNQLPPIIKNVAFQKFSNMEQSLYTRFVRLGVPLVELDAQGRCRESLCSLFRWRYRKLGDLPFVVEEQEYKMVNPGFSFDYQLIDVVDFNGIGESEPVPYFYQNLAEAEFVVGTFMYMRLLGYPAEKITILTTYNGQKHLIRDVIAQRCASNPFIGTPHTITTVDKFQGSQNDYILLSLVRTKAVGHLRDVRRLVVAMSRARLGLYIFARVSLFRNCFELSKSFDVLLQRPQKLLLFPEETYPPAISLTDPRQGTSVTIENMPQMSQFVYNFYEKKIKEWKEKRPEIFETVTKKRSEPEEEHMDDEHVQQTVDEDELGFEKLTADDTGMEDAEDLRLSASDDDVDITEEDLIEKAS